MDREESVSAIPAGGGSGVTGAGYGPRPTPPARGEGTRVAHRGQPSGRPARDVPPGAGEFSAAVWRLWWTTRPTLRVAVRPGPDRLLVTGRPGTPEIEVDPGERLSLAFRGSVLTSLCLDGVSRWDGRAAEVELARRLLGPRASAAVPGLLPAGGEVQIMLGAAEAAALVDVWDAFVAAADGNRGAGGAGGNTR